ncbi:MAG: peptidylprolyl isomerase [Chitinophagaceae bacterium]|nr:MAG: peptidylprolyl isomerase [Chitinophagaceae bacterium]
MKKYYLLLFGLFIIASSFAQNEVVVKKRDRKKDIELQTSLGNIVIRLSDATPLHRDNFLKLAKNGFYDSVLFHRVIQNFMIQSGDPNSKAAEKGKPLGNGGPSYTIPAEFSPELFHKKGVVAAARMGDNVNPKKESSGSQFYIVQGKLFTDEGLDSVERVRLNGRKLSAAHREYYKTIGGTPQLDQNYTVFGEVIIGMEVVNTIAATPTSKGTDRDRPLEDIRIISIKMLKRK